MMIMSGILNSQTLQSPSKEISLAFSLDSGKPSYTVSFRNKPVVEKSYLGMILKDTDNLQSGFEVVKTEGSAFDKSWKPVLGEVSSIRNRYNQLTVQLSQNSTGRKLNIIFRAFDEGIAFRYEFPKQDKLNYFIVSKETTEFNLAGDHKAFWIPGDIDSQ